MFNETEGLNKAILESSTYIIVATDLSGTILAYNRAAQLALGYTPEEIIGKKTPAIWHDLNEIKQRSIELSKELGRKIEPNFDVFTQKLYINGSETAEWTFIAKDGHRFHGKLVATVVKDHQGKIIGYLGVAEDLTEKNRLESERLLLISRLKMATQSFGMGVWDLDFQKDELIWDDRMYELYDIPKSNKELTYESWASKIHPDDLPMILNKIDESIKTNSEFNAEFRLLLKNKQIRVIQATALIKTDANKNPIRMVGFNLDITEKRKADLLKKEFISIVSHELRTPLTAIRGSLALLLNAPEKVTAERTKTLLKIADENSARLLYLINDILDFEKISVGKRVLMVEKENIVFAVNRCIELNQSYIDKYNSKVIMTERCDPCFAMIDMNSFMQVLTNLISNAVKFSFAQKPIYVAINRKENRIRISVTNQGAGIPDEAKPKIFEKFYQVDSSSSREKGGTGLGLTISKALVEKMNGVIGFTSIPNKETVFFIEFDASK